MWEDGEAMQHLLICSYSISPLSPHTSPTPHTQKAIYIRALRLTSVPFDPDIEIFSFISGDETDNRASV